ncbi:MAG: hypothetical protein PVF33_09300, partial [Candidatus Latescibacterota bacterium]
WKVRISLPSPSSIWKIFAATRELLNIIFKEFYAELELRACVICEALPDAARNPPDRTNVPL